MITDPTPHAAPRRIALVLAGVALVAGLTACRSERNVAGGGTTTTAATTTTTSTSTTSTTSTTTTTTPPTTTTIPIVTEGGIVKVANSSGVDGAARRLTDELAALGFETRDPVNGAGPDDDIEVSKIYVKEGSEAVAASISRLMGGLDVQPMPTPAWITGATEALGDATVLVMLGHDLAGTPLADMAG